jgi:3-hydroxyisobutyrate dehydrogenase-like beta-hydroxyacid dehydrogenase
MKIGFIGLGQMGKPMAINLLKSGSQVGVQSADTTAYPALRQAGATPVERAVDLADADVVFLCLPHGDVVRDVLFGSGGLAARMRPGQTVVDTSTIAYNTTLEVATALRQAGIDFIDAPVSGMEARAVDGTLTVMCGGERPVFDRIEPLLKHMGNQILFMGPAGSGQLTKLINQLLFDINCAGLAEILPMAVKMGLDPDQVGAVINSGTGRSYASEFFVPRVLQRGFSSGYPMKHAYKDLVSAAELGARLCIPMPVLAAATATYQTALLMGHGERDKGAMLLPFEELLGVQFRSRAA